MIEKTRKALFHVYVVTLAVGVVLAILTLPFAGFAEDAPNPNGPVIHLADNLGEADGLGWCIDTLGRGLAETLQIHSCKPQGGDTQFRYDAEAQQIQSVAFKGKCVVLRDADNTAAPFGLFDCVADDRRSSSTSTRIQAGSPLQPIQPNVWVQARTVDRLARSCPVI